MDIVKTFTYNELKIEIDEIGGIHFHNLEDDSSVSCSPVTMREVEEARREVLDYE